MICTLPIGDANSPPYSARRNTIKIVRVERGETPSAHKAKNEYKYKNQNNMKKLNFLTNWCSGNSEHVKTRLKPGKNQVKTSFRFIALLTMLLTIGIGNVWGAKITDYRNIVSGTEYYIGATTGGNDYYWSSPQTTTGTGLSGTAVTSKASATIVILEGSGTSWKIKIKGTSNYVTLKSTKANGKFNIAASSSNWTFSNASSLIKMLYTGSYCLQKNNSGTQFGSYANNQTNVWLEEAAAAATFTMKVPVGDGTFKTLSSKSATDMTYATAQSGNECTYGFSSAYDSYWTSTYRAKEDATTTKPSPTYADQSKGGATVPSGVTLYPIYVDGDKYHTDPRCMVYTYDLTYDANGGTGAPSNQTGNTSGSTVTVSSTEPTRSGYTFMGWSTSSTATTKDDNYDPGDSFTITADVALYAVWCKDLSTSSITVNEPTLTSYNTGTSKWTVNVTWTAVDGATYYTVQCGDRATSTVVLSETNVGNVTSYTISGLTNAHEHRIIVTAKHAYSKTG